MNSIKEKGHRKKKKTFKYHFGRSKFHIIPQYCIFSHSLLLNNLLRLLLTVNQIYQVTLFRCINWDDEVTHLVRGSKVLGGMKYLMMSVKQAAEAVGIWTEYNWDVKRLNSLYTMVSGRFNFKIGKRFDALSWSSGVRYFYIRRC